MADVVIFTENLGKRYRIIKPEEQHDTLVGKLLFHVKKPLHNLKRLKSLTSFNESKGDSVFWALKNVSFEIRRGEIVGLIGINGAGKSTLLKILAKITAPTEGKALIRGRIGSLLEVGTGFHPELSGKENIYLNGSILGMTKKEITRKLDDIVAFSEIEKFIDTPVKRYSSGMRVRLGFAVAAHLDPEILLVDEVLAVGDVAFQQKCLAKMDDVASEGRTVIFVSHNMEMIQRLCPRCILLSNGQKVIDGKTDQTIDRYFQDTPFFKEQNGISLFDAERSLHYGETLRFSKCIIINSKNISSKTLLLGEPFKIQVEAVALKNLSNVDFQISIRCHDRSILTCFQTSEKGRLFNLAQDETIVITFEYKNMILNSGKYFVRVSALQFNRSIDNVSFANSLTVSDINFNEGEHYASNEGSVRYYPDISID
jgi:lipopolysaccharide transport system ATP-binding protein